MERTQAFIDRFIQFDQYLFTSHENDLTIQWLRDHQLLLHVEQFTCDTCQGPMQQGTDNDRVDGYRMLCLDCGARKSIRLGSIFDGSREPLVVFYRVFFCCFTSNMTIQGCCDVTGLSRATVRRYYKYCRTLTARFLVESRDDPLGIETIQELRHPDDDPEDPESFENSPAVEIDEFLMTHHTGPGRKGERQIWVMGILDRATREVRAFAVPDRRQETLIQLIRENVGTDISNRTRVYTDGWRGYQNINGDGYDHRQINHSETYGIGSEHTNNIENYWSRMRDISEFEYGVHVESVEAAQVYVDSLVWKIQNRGNEINALTFILGIYQEKISDFE